MSKIKMEKNQFSNLPDLPVLGQKVKILRPKRPSYKQYVGLTGKLVSCSLGRTMVIIERQHRFRHNTTGKLFPPQTIRLQMPWWCLTEKKTK